MANINVTSRVVPNFPAKVQGSGGVDVNKTNGVYTISLDLDQFSNQEGSILYRGPTSWIALLRGQNGQVLRSTATSIEWATSSADQTFVGAAPIDVNTVGSTTTTSIDLDFYSSSQGSLITRNATTWVGLPAGTTGQVLAVGSSGNLEFTDSASNPLNYVIRNGPQLFTTSGTWTKPVGCRAVIATCIGGGGGGGGCTISLPSAGKAGAGGGGGGGGYSQSAFVDVTAISSIPYTVGAGGNGGIGGTAGSAGGQTSFDTHAVAGGGSGGQEGAHQATTTGRFGGNGGSGSSGNVNAVGQGGGASFATGGIPMQGFGGNSYFGGGARAGVTNNTSNGTNGGNYGGGGGGGSNGDLGTVAANGGNGADGCIILQEFY